MALDTGDQQKTFNWEDPLDLASRLTEEERMVWESARAYAREKLLPRVVSAFAMFVAIVSMRMRWAESPVDAISIPRKSGGRGVWTAAV